MPEDIHPLVDRRTEGQLLGCTEISELLSAESDTGAAWSLDRARVDTDPWASESGCPKGSCRT